MVKAKRKNQKQNTLWIYLLVAFVVIVALILFVGLKDKNEGGIFNNATVLDFSPEVKYLNDCLAVQDIPASQREESLKLCPDVKKEEVEKLSQIDGARGEEVCNSFGAIDNGGTYRKCFDFIRGCNQIFQLIDSEGDGNGKDKKFYQIFECGSDDYYVYWHILPPEIKVVRVYLSQETINGLAILDTQ